MCGMPGDHAPFAHCEAFASGIGPSVDAMAIWASSPNDVGQLASLTAVLRTALGD